MWLQRKRELNWGAFPLTGVFDTTDGAVVIVGAFKANPLQDICRALDLPDLSANPETATFAGQVKHKAELHRQFRSRLSTNTTAYWLGRLEEQDLLCAPVQSLPDALASEQTTVNGMVVSMEANGSGRNEPLRLVGTPISMADDAFALRHAPPSLGEHGAEILAELGYAPDRIAALRAAKVVS